VQTTSDCRGPCQRLFLAYVLGIRLVSRQRPYSQLGPGPGQRQVVNNNSVTFGCVPHHHRRASRHPRRRVFRVDGAETRHSAGLQLHRLHAADTCRRAPRHRRVPEPRRPGVNELSAVLQQFVEDVAKYSVSDTVVI